MGFTCGEDDVAAFMPQTGFKKERKRVSTLCSKCGGKCLRNRDPNDDGSYTETPSNFAIEGEKKRCSYRCGKCGQEKKGHVCTGSGDAPLPAMPAILNAEHVLKKAKTLLGHVKGDEGEQGEVEHGHR